MNPPPIPTENARHLAWLRDNRALVADMTQDQIAAVAYFIYGMAEGPNAWTKAGLLARYDESIADYAAEVANEERMAALFRV